MLLQDIVTTSQRVTETSSRLAKVDALAACLRRLAPTEIEIGVGFLAGEVRQGRLGVGYAALKDSAPGSTATAASLTLLEVDRALEEVASQSGAGSSERRKQTLGALFARATDVEQRFLIRLLLGELRQGALEGLMLEALAKASGLVPAQLRRAAMFAGKLAAVAKAALTQGAAGLTPFALQLFRPVQPMLAQPAEDVADALAQLGRAAFEWKLDGARVQVHRSGGEVRVYTRNLNDVTAAVPEVVEAVRDLGVDPLVLDGETLALRPDGAPQPFQVTMRRFGRKLDVAALRAELPLRVSFFDCLQAGETLIDRPTEERFRALADALPPPLIVPRLVTAEEAAAQAFFADALAHGHEGVMVKSLLAPYEAGSRGSAWLKVKQADTLDLVVIAVEWGSGRRSGWLSNLHLGARDPMSGGFVMLGKTFKGMTDAMLAWQTEKLLALEISRDRHTVYVKPELVVEIAFNDVQASPQYPAGLALRFARVKRYRPDKRADQVDTIDSVRAIYARGLRASVA